MRSLILVVAISAIAWARPETYKETEEFQYARSSSDEGSKSGFYGAQRGNVAGNYEKAHNMDSLAQHQMSGAINQVQGELGDASKTGAGSVYTAANTRGVYGSGQYDLANLQGRNFGEHSSSDSHSSLSSAYNQHSNSDWRSQSQQAGYGASSQLGQSSQRLGTLQAAEGAGYGSDYGSNSLSRSSGYHSASGYHSQSGYNSQNNYDTSLSGQSGAYGTGDQSRRYTIVTPVRIVARPGTQIAVPVYGQAGYDAHRASSSFGQSSSNLYASQTAASSFDQNAINSEAEVLNNNQQHVGSVPAANGKHYSSSYNYQKAWERNSETTDAPVPVAPVANPLSANSELYEDAQGANAFNSASRYNGYSKGSSQSNYAQHSSQSAANSNAYTQGAYGSHSGLASIVDSTPKSYQSSYSYHKSWEKQGDPYVIVPGTNGEASQRIVSANTKNSASSQRYGSHQHHSQGSAVDCDSLCRYRRSTRSADYYQQDLGQQAQTGWDQSLSQQVQDNFQPQSQSANLEDLGQKTQDLENFGQQTQQTWGSLQQQSQSAKLEDLGQQTQDLENLGQQTQQSWGNLQQHSPSGKLENLGQQTQDLEDLGQQTQESWGNLQQHSQSGKLEDLGQQTQDLKDLGQQTQQSWGNLHQHSQSGKLEDLGQQTQDLGNFGQQTQGKWHELNQRFENNLENLGQQTQQSWNNIEQQASRQNPNLDNQTQGQRDNTMTDDSQQSQQTFENVDNLGQQTQNKWDNTEGLGQQTRQTWGVLSNNEQESEILGQQTDNKWVNLDNLGQQVQNQWDNINTTNKTRHTHTNTEQQTQSHVGINFHEITPNREHAGGNTQVNFNKENPDANNPNDLAFWGLTNEQKHDNSNYYNQHSYNNYNSYSNSQGHGVNWGQHHNNNNAHTSNNNPLQSIWDNLDDMEEQSEHSSNENQQHTENQNSQHSYGQESSYNHDSNSESSNSSYNWNQQQTHYLGNQPPIMFNRTIEKPKNELLPKEIIPGKQLPTEVTPEIPEDNDETPEKPDTADVGRGDIGPEDVSKTTPKTVHNTQSHTIQTKPEKSLEEIEALSLSRGADEESTDSLSVLSISQQKQLEEERQRAAEELHIRGSKSTTTTSRPTYVHIEEVQDHNKAQPTVIIHKNDQQNQQQLSNFGHHSQNFNQHGQNFDQNHQNFDQQNTEQELQDFGQQTRDLDQENLQQFTNLGQHNQYFNQQNTGQQMEDFGHQTRDLNQQNVQQFTYTQHSQNIGQENTGQHLLDFGQQTQDFSQQNLEQLHDLGQHSQKYDQQNTEQQLEDFGQQTQNSDQQNLQLFTNSEQHSQNSNQHQAREFVSHSDKQVVQEQKITPASDPGSHTHPKQEVEIVPPSVTTEKPGFWRSVGNKFSSAKDSVASWFKS